MISNSSIKKFISAAIVLAGMGATCLYAYQIKVTNNIGDQKVSVYAGNANHSYGKELKIEEMDAKHPLKNTLTATIHAKSKGDMGIMKFKGAFTLFIFDGSSPFSAWCRIQTLANVEDYTGHYTHNHENHGNIRCTVEGEYTKTPTIRVERRLPT